MRRYVVISIVFHALIIVIALFLISNKRHEEQKPFIARIVTPEELSNEAKKEIKAVLKEDRTIKRHHESLIHGIEREAPKVLSAIPSSPSAKRTPLGPPALTKELPTRGAGMKSLPDMEGAKGHRVESGDQPSEKSSPPGGKQAALRDRLFDRDIIAKLSKQEQEGVKNSSSITFNTEKSNTMGTCNA